MAVLSSPSISISVKAGIQIKSIPPGATNPLAMATALTAWFKAPAPIVCISALPSSLITPAKAYANEFGLVFADTLSRVVITLDIPPEICFMFDVNTGFLPLPNRIYKIVIHHDQVNSS
jgi:hypothetical protein